MFLLMAGAAIRPGGKPGRKGALQKKKQGKAFRLSIIGDYQ